MRDSSARPQLSLAIPCYNEQEVLANTVVHLVDAFAQRQISLELVLVDNGSTDGTGRVIDELIGAGYPVVKQVVPVNRGYGHGVLCGLAACRGRFVGILHADGQVDPHDVVKVYEVAASAKSPTLVKVRRRFRMDGMRRKVISVAYNLSANILFPRLGSIDINGSPKMFPQEYLARLNLCSADWFIDPELMIKARRVGLSVIEFNVLAQMRKGGQSHVDGRTCLEFMVNLLKYRFGRGAARDARSQSAVACPAILDRVNRTA